MSWLLHVWLVLQRQCTTKWCLQTAATWQIGHMWWVEIKSQQGSLNLWLSAAFWCHFKQSTNIYPGWHVTILLCSFGYISLWEDKGHALRGTEWYKADSEHHIHIITTDMWSSTQMCWTHCTTLTLLSPACSYLPSSRGTQSRIQGLRKITGCS